MIKKIDRALDKTAYLIIVISVLGMLLLTVLNIFLRWFNMTILWIDPFVRHLVFLSAFMGGVLATGQDKHIRIDLFGKFLEKTANRKLKIWVERIIYIVVMITTGLLTKAGVDFCKVEYEFGKIAFLGLHSGALVTIIPVGMGFIFTRYFIKFLDSFFSELKGHDE